MEFCKVFQMTFDEYDKLVESFDAIEAPLYWPDVNEIDKMEEDPSKWILMACYLLEKNEKPKNATENYSKKNLNNFVNSHLELVENDSEVIEKPKYF